MTNSFATSRKLSPKLISFILDILLNIKFWSDFLLSGGLRREEYSIKGVLEAKVPMDRLILGGFTVEWSFQNAQEN